MNKRNRAKEAMRIYGQPQNSGVDLLSTDSVSQPCACVRVYVCARQGPPVQSPSNSRKREVALPSEMAERGQWLLPNDHAVVTSPLAILRQHPCTIPQCLVSNFRSGLDSTSLLHTSTLSSGQRKKQAATSSRCHTNYVILSQQMAHLA